MTRPAALALVLLLVVIAAGCDDDDKGDGLGDQPRLANATDQDIVVIYEEVVGGSAEAPVLRTRSQAIDDGERGAFPLSSLNWDGVLLVYYQRELYLLPVANDPDTWPDEQQTISLDRLTRQLSRRAGAPAPQPEPAGNG